MKKTGKTHSQIFYRFVVAASSLLVTSTALSLEIVDQGTQFNINNGDYQWVIKKDLFNVISEGYVLGEQKVNGGEASVVFSKDGGATTEKLTFSLPLEFLQSDDWLELRGWASQEHNLWYVARYKFKANSPVVHLTLSLTDRHNTGRTEGPWDAEWYSRLISNFKVEISSPMTLDPISYTQYSSHFGGASDKPFVDVISSSGSPYLWARDKEAYANDVYQLQHRPYPDGANQIVWHPRYEGDAILKVKYKPRRFNHHQTYGVSYEINHASGSTTVLENQSKQSTEQYFNLVDLGDQAYTLNMHSSIILKSTGEDVYTDRAGAGEALVVAHALQLVDPNDGYIIEEIELGRRLENDILSQQELSFVINDLWQNHPIEAYAGQNTMGVNVILMPTVLMGGMGKTLDVVISMAGDTQAANAMLEPLPRPQLPEWWDTADGTLATLNEYDSLIRSASKAFKTADELSDNFGWQHWGDYQIGGNFINLSGLPTQDWGSLQLDLPTVLMLAWMRTGDPYLWSRARAAIRHMMDIDVVKFQPFRDKFAGAMHRKGECESYRAHVCQEPVFDYSFAWRALLLYHHITGEAWAKEIAKMQIDNAAYIAKTRTDGYAQFLLNGRRPFGWISRALINADTIFPAGTTYLSAGTEVPMPTGTKYTPLLDHLMSRMLNDRINNTDFINNGLNSGRIPGSQPVWMGQSVEALIAYNRIANRDDIRAGIIKSVKYFVEHSIRQLDDGTVEIVYGGDTAYNEDLVADGIPLNEARHDPLQGQNGKDPRRWVSIKTSRTDYNYGWLWLSSLTFAHQIDPNYQDDNGRGFIDWANIIYDHVFPLTEKETSIRPWTSALGYGGIYIEHMSSVDITPPSTPINFRGTLEPIQ